MAAFAATKASSVTCHHITWIFDKEHEIGQFVTGDWWVVSPVNIISITNDLNDKSFLPEDGTAVNGSMINPKVSDHTNHRTVLRQGYDERVFEYDPALNAALPNGKPLSADNPLALQPDQSLISTVSWLWRTPDDREEGAPKPLTDGQGARPTLRAAAVLTSLAKAPPEGTFRPAYAGDEKRLFNVSQLRLDRLRNLDPVENIVNKPYHGAYPEADNLAHYLGDVSIPHLAYATSTLWLDHVPTWFGMHCYHPTLNMPNYGRSKCLILSAAMLALHLDWNKIESTPPDKPEKTQLLNNIVQLGIDFAGIADAGGFWHGDGGHGAGRKPTILFAGLLLDDPHMMNVGKWKTEFHDDDQIFYVTEADIARDAERLTNPENPHTGEIRHPGAIYTRAMLGMPEWRGKKNEGIEAAWVLNYRVINNSYYPSFALALALTGDEGHARKLYNHDAFFDYTDRVMTRDDNFNYASNNPPHFGTNMWRAYRGLVQPAPDTARWYTPDILAVIDAPDFKMWYTRNAGIYEAGQPVRIAITQPADLSALNAENVRITSAAADKTPVPLERLETDPEGTYIELVFPPGALKPGRYHATIDPAAYHTILDSRKRKLYSNRLIFTVK